MPKRKCRVYTGYAPIGTHGHLYYFDSGFIAARYPGLYEIYKKRLLPDFVKVKITYELPLKKKGILHRHFLKKRCPGKVYRNRRLIRSQLSGKIA